MTSYARQHDIAQMGKRKLGRDFTIEAGVVRWTSNGRVAPGDCAEILRDHYGHPVDMAAHAIARDAEVSKSIAAYRRTQATRTPEQVAEWRAMARAAHGPGVRLIDVVTGEAYTT